MTRKRSENGTEKTGERDLGGTAYARKREVVRRAPGSWFPAQYSVPSGAPILRGPNSGARALAEMHFRERDGHVVLVFAQPGTSGCDGEVLVVVRIGRREMRLSLRKIQG